MTNTDLVYSAINAGCRTYGEIQIVAIGLEKHQIVAVTSYLKCNGYIHKTGHGDKAVFTINPKKCYGPDTSLPSDTSEEMPVSDKQVLDIPDFNQMFLDMVEALGEQIAIKAKERAYAILNTPETANALAHELMGRFSMPVVVFNGPEQTTLTFNTPAPAPAPIHSHACCNISGDIAVGELPATDSVIDPSLMQAPKDPQVVKPRVRLPKVCVTGMKPTEAGKISEEFAETFDLAFWNDRQGDGVDQLKACSKNCDAVFWHVKHGSHSDEEIARGGSAKFVRVGGDLTQMRNKLREYFHDLKNPSEAS